MEGKLTRGTNFNETCYKWHCFSAFDLKPEEICKQFAAKETKKGLAYLRNGTSFISSFLNLKKNQQIVLQVNIIKRHTVHKFTSFPF